MDITTILTSIYNTYYDIAQIFLCFFFNLFSNFSLRTSTFRQKTKYADTGIPSVHNGWGPGAIRAVYDITTRYDIPGNNFTSRLLRSISIRPVPSQSASIHYHSLRYSRSCPVSFSRCDVPALGAESALNFRHRKLCPFNSDNDNDNERDYDDTNNHGNDNDNDNNLTTTTTSIITTSTTTTTSTHT